MIHKLIHEAQLTKDDRKKFIPFVNQRDHMGLIIKNKHKDKEQHKSMDIFQNLKKTTKEYFFDKKFQKMKQKLQRCQQSLEQKQPNYDQQIKSCFRALQRNPNIKSKESNQTSFEQSNIFFVDLNQKLSENISTLKEEIKKNKKSKTEVRHGTFHNNLSLSKTSHEPPNSLTLLTLNKTTKQNFNHKHEQLRRKTIINSKQKDYLQNKTSTSPINRKIFKDVGPMSQTMADFTNYGLKYKYLVKPQKKDPWKKWYVNSKIEIFPGETVKVKKLQKSIYD